MGKCIYCYGPMAKRQIYVKKCTENIEQGTNIHRVESIMTLQNTTINLDKMDVNNLCSF